MSMWMLTDERKNDLLKQRDHKLDELRQLKVKSPKKLWTEDLDALIKKMDEVEAKERAEEEQLRHKLMKGQASAGVKGRNIKTMSNKKDATKPSPDGESVYFKLSEEALKKYEKATAASRGIKKEKKVKSEAGELDEFDQLVEGGSGKKEVVKKPRVKKEPGEAKPKKEKKSSDGMKQTKLAFKKVIMT